MVYVFATTNLKAEDISECRLSNFQLVSQIHIKTVIIDG